jgi:hypothetical protein
MTQELGNEIRLGLHASLRRFVYTELLSKVRQTLSRSTPRDRTSFWVEHERVYRSLLIPLRHHPNTTSLEAAPSALTPVRRLVRQRYPYYRHQRRALPGRLACILLLLLRLLLPVLLGFPNKTSCARKPSSSHVGVICSVCILLFVLMQLREFPSPAVAAFVL